MAVEYAPRGLIGVLTPQANTTVEPEFSILWPPGYGMINARMVSDKGTAEKRLVDYFNGLDAVLTRFANAPLSAVAFACTGASYLVGAAAEDDTVARLSERLGIPFVTAGLAVADGLNVLGAQRIGLVSPYPPALTEASVPYWQARGFEVAGVASASLDESLFHPIYSIPAGRTTETFDRLRAEHVDAIVMLGTGMPTLETILERAGAVGVPLLSCMLARAWRTVAAVDGRAPDATELQRWIAGEHWKARFAAQRPSRR